MERAREPLPLWAAHLSLTPVGVQVEDFMRYQVAPTYANTHTEGSATGRQTSQFREEARTIVARSVDADPKEYATLFTGTGMTGALMKLIRALGIVIPPNRATKLALAQAIPEGDRPVIFVGPMEHHSNVLPWREAFADVVELRETTPEGQIDVAQLKAELKRYHARELKILTFSAGSNVTGITVDVPDVARIAKAYGALVIVDYAGAGPYTRMSVCPGGVQLDAIVASPHKLVGGPGSSGLLVARRKLFSSEVPTEPGGGTVRFVTPWGHRYHDEVEAREDGGTPGIMQAIRCGLAFAVREKVGIDVIEALCARRCSETIMAWRANDNLLLIGANRRTYHERPRLPIISFNVLMPRRGPPGDSRCGAKRPSDLGPAAAAADARRVLHPSFIITLLNDLYGIQSRSGCSCAGPYGARVLELDRGTIEEVQDIVVRHRLESVKPGWARVNMSWTMREDEVAYVREAVLQVANEGWKLLPLYAMDPRSGSWEHRCGVGMEQDVRHLSAMSLDPNPAAHAAITATHAKPPSFEAALKAATEIYRRAPELVGPLRKSVLADGGDFVGGDGGVLGSGGDQKARAWMHRYFAMPSEVVAAVCTVDAVSTEAA